METFAQKEVLMRILTISEAFFLGLFSLLVFSTSGFAQTKTVTEGRHLVQPCARCHVIVANGPPSWTDAPSFESIANRPSLKKAWLVNFIQQQHLHMLTDTYTSAQANSIAAYILSLRQK